MPYAGFPVHVEEFLHVDTVPLGLTIRSTGFKMPSVNQALPNWSPAIAVAPRRVAATPLRGPSSEPVMLLPARVTATPLPFVGYTARTVKKVAVLPTKMVKLLALEEMPKPRGVLRVATARPPLAPPVPPLKAQFAMVHAVPLEGNG
jgi:hypothetical protein